MLGLSAALAAIAMTVVATMASFGSHFFMRVI
jgi:hypothetical protein